MRRAWSVGVFLWVSMMWSGEVVALLVSTPALELSRCCGKVCAGRRSDRVGTMEPEIKAKWEAIENGEEPDSPLGSKSPRILQGIRSPLQEERSIGIAPVLRAIAKLEKGVRENGQYFVKLNAKVEALSAKVDQAVGNAHFSSGDVSMGGPAFW